jgi:hypothetical protein
MLALIKNEENAAENYDVEADDLETAAEGVLSLFDEVDSRIYDADQKRCVLNRASNVGSRKNGHYKIQPI